MKASHERVMVGESGCGQEGPPDQAGLQSRVPIAIRKVASVGFTEEQSRKGYKIKLALSRSLGNGKAIALGEPDGMIKDDLRRGRQGELLGAHT